MEDSARFYQNMYQEISDELSTSREGATEKAMQLLLEEERKYAQMRFNKTLSIIVYSIIATLLGIYLFWQQWRKRKKQYWKQQSEKYPYCKTN
jgi:ABC-type nickel/cobalt efflux system permease component RcnA